MIHRTLQTFSIALLAIIATFIVLDQAQGLFAPIISALLLGVVLTPLSDFWDRLRLPPALAAFVSVSLALMIILLLLFLLEPYVTQVINRAPLIWIEIRGTVDEFRRALRGIEQVTADVAEAIESGDGAAAADTMTVPTLTDALFYAPQFLGQLLIFTGTLYFFLMARNAVYDWVGETFSSFGESDLRYAGKQVAQYVLTISAINLTFGILVTIIMSLIGMPSPILWGFLAFSLNYIMYLGPSLLIVMLLIAGIVTFDGAMSFVPAAIYLGMNATEAQFITPALVGRSLSVNPLLVFLSLVFWLWLWGPIGGIIAIPLTIWFIAMITRAMDQTISSGTPGKLPASSSAGATE